LDKAEDSVSESLGYVVFGWRRYGTNGYEVRTVDYSCAFAGKKNIPYGQVVM